MGMMSLRFSDPLAMRFGPRKALLPSLCRSAPGCCCSRARPVDGTYAVDILPPMILLGLGAGIGFPALMTLAMSGATPRTPGWPRASSTPPYRSAARSALPSWPRSPPSAPTACCADGESIATALNSGYHLAYLIGAAMVGVALVVVLGVVRTEAPTAQPADGKADAESELSEAA